MRQGPGSGRSPPWRLLGRLGITVAAPRAVAALGLVPIPGIDVGLLLSMGAQPSAATSVAALGIMPLLVAAALVELACLVTRRGRAFRVSGPTGRRAMWRATAAGAFVIAAIQAIGISMYLSSAGLYLEPGGLAHLAAVISLVTGAALIVGVAAAASRYGLCNGLSAIIAGSLVIELAGGSLGLAERVALGELSALPVAAVAACAAAVCVVTIRAAGRGLILAASPNPIPRFRTPASGALPVTEALAVLAVPAAVAGLGLPALDALAAILSPHGIFGLSVALALGVGLAVLFAFLFHQPLRVAALRARLDGRPSSPGEGLAPSRERVFDAMKDAALYVAALLAAGFAADRLSGGFAALDAVGVAIVTAVILDLRAEWIARRGTRHWVAVWPEPRVYGADAAAEALGRAGVPVHLRGLHHRVLLQLFGPYIPIDVFVPRDRADEARRILEPLLTAEPTIKAPSSPAAT